MTLSDRHAARILLAIGLALAAGPGASQAATLHFDAPVYNVMEGHTFQAQVLLDMDDATPGDQSLTGGLFSAGAQVLFDGAKSAATVIVLPPDLNSNGLGGEPTESIGPGHAGAAGVIAFDAVGGYTGHEVLAVTMTNLATGTYALELALFFDPPLSSFVAFDTGQSIDDQITNLVSATVNVLEPPRITGLARASNDEARITCLMPGGYVPAHIGLEQASAPGPGGEPVWAPVPSALFVPLGGGEYQVDAPQEASSALWYRIRVTP